MKQFYFTGLCMAFALTVNAQGKLLPSDSLLSQIPGRYLSSMERKADRVSHYADKTTSKALNNMARLEGKLQRHLQKADPAKAEELFGKASAKVAGLKGNLSAAAANASGGYLDNYTDTLEGTLKFLDAGKLSGAVNAKALDKATKSFSELTGRLHATEDLKAQLAARKQQLNEALAGVAGCKQLTKKLGKTMDYYSQQANDYKAMLQDPTKAEKKAMQLLRKSDLYKKAIAKYSPLAALFNINMNENPAQALPGLQTNNSVLDRIGASVGGDPAARQSATQQMDQAQSVISQAKDKLPTGSGNVGDVPDLALNPMKKKRFLKRLEYGADIQSQRSTLMLPTMTDVSLQAGYKFNSKAVAGIGLAYKLGWGKSISHINLTSEGIGFRSFASYKLKGKFHAAGGLEYNRFTRFGSFSELSKWNGWTRSALLGGKVMIRENGKPKASMLVLYDFLAPRTMPKQSAFKIRYQYTL